MAQQTSSSTGTLVLVSSDALSRAADAIVRRAYASGALISKNAVLNALAAAIAGPGHDWGFVKNAPVAADGLGRLVQPGLDARIEPGRVAPAPVSPAAPALPQAASLEMPASAGGGRIDLSPLVDALATLKGRMAAAKAGEDAPEAASEAGPAPAGVRPTSPFRAPYVAEFTPQAWVNDWTMAVDPQGDTVWPVDQDEIDALVAEGFTLEDLLEPDSDASDSFRDSRHAPQWVRDWTGPFAISLMTACRTCGDGYELAGDGFDGECPSCADRSFVRDELEAGPDDLLIGVTDIVSGAATRPGDRFTARTDTGVARFVLVRLGAPCHEEYVLARPEADAAGKPADETAGRV